MGIYGETKEKVAQLKLENGRYFYKSKMSKENMKKRGIFLPHKRSQMTIFVIVAIMIIVVAVLIYFLYPIIKTNIGIGSKNPSIFLQNCLEDKINEGIELLSKQGGSIEPEFYFLYNNEKVEYLCYAESFYQTCVMQQPMLKRHIEGEIKNYIDTDAKNCLESLRVNYQNRGYNVQMKSGDIDVEILPNIVSVNFNESIVLTKDETERYNSIRVSVKNNIYELVSIANSILNWEAKYGDAETTTYMNYYHDLKVEKKKQLDGTTIYILTDRNSDDKFQFASRSVAWPPGYGAEEVY